MAKEHRIFIRTTPEERDAWHQAAAKQGTTISKICREALDQLLTTPHGTSQDQQ